MEITLKTFFWLVTFLFFPIFFFWWEVGGGGVVGWLGMNDFFPGVKRGGVRW